MKKIVSLFLLLLSLNTLAVELKVGDILLQPLDCWSCSLIEDEEQSIYSHMGIVLSVDPVMVADSLGKVRVQRFESFNSITEKGQKLGVLRFKNSKLVEEIQDRYVEMVHLFQSEFEGLEYDKAFLWDNFDSQGRQKLYCSEFVAKFLQAFIGMEPIVKRMHFSRNPEIWEKYFKGPAPVGKWGNSPADFERSHHFYFVGEL